jgi:SH3-like domain-containing protein
MAARKSDPVRSQEVMESERLAFDHAVLAYAEERELRRVRYRMVRLSDGPDEILSYEIGRLDKDDEVEVLDRTGVYVRVRTPSGVEGWVHRTTLGDRITLDEADGTDSTRQPQFA